MHMSFLHTMATWIVDGGPKALWWRFGAIVAGSFLYGLIMDWKDGDLTSFWWVSPALFSIFVGTAFSLWRLMEHRRRAARLRQKSVTLLDLG